MPRAKIVCTLGPASSDRATIRALIDAGMSVARLNFSHGTHADHRRVYEIVREESTAAGIPVAVLQDLQGPKLRVGEIADGGVTLEAGATFRLTAEPRIGDATGASISYAPLHRDVQIGETILVDDGMIGLRVSSVGPGWVDTVVETGGVLKTKKGVNLPNTAITLPSLTAKDRADLALGLELGVDYVALSFVRSALDIHQVRACFGDAPCAPHVIAKIEKPQAVRSLEEIVSAADGIMIARGDLGVELPPERVPIIQKQAIELAESLAKVSITATQMLESMTMNARPTRAEASDVANAIFDGTDAVMLSGETAAGDYPVETVRMMARIVVEAERSQFRPAHRETPLGALVPTSSRAVARAATTAAKELGAVAIACFTMSGRTPRLIKAYNPAQRVVALTPRPEVCARMALYGGIVPVLTEVGENTDELFRIVERSLCDGGLARTGDEVIIVMGVPVEGARPANLIKFHRIP